MKKEIPAEAYWKLRGIALEMALGKERRAHMGRLQALLRNARGFIEELALTLQEFDGVLAGAADSYTAKYEEVKTEIGGEIGMEGRPEEWHVELIGEADSFMERKE